MITENNYSGTPESLVRMINFKKKYNFCFYCEYFQSEEPQSSQLNPDAVEFKPSWMKPPSTTTNEGSFVILTSNQSEEQKKKI